MTKQYVRNAGKLWSSTEERKLSQLAVHNTPKRVIALKLGRPESGVRAKASQLRVSLKPVNQSPYGRKS